jgi:hypothetical protein
MTRCDATLPVTQFYEMKDRRKHHNSEMANIHTCYTCCMRIHAIHITVHTSASTVLHYKHVLSAASKVFLKVIHAINKCE